MKLVPVVRFGKPSKAEVERFYAMAKGEKLMVGNELVSPNGVVIELGQRWKELDPRFHRVLEVVGWDIRLKKVQCKSIRTTWISLSRFNGKRGGYARI